MFPTVDGNVTEKLIEMAAGQAAGYETAGHDGSDLFSMRDEKTV